MDLQELVTDAVEESVKFHDLDTYPVPFYLSDVLYHALTNGELLPLQVAIAHVLFHEGDDGMPRRPPREYIHELGAFLPHFRRSCVQMSSRNTIWGANWYEGPLSDAARTEGIDVAAIATAAREEHARIYANTGDPARPLPHTSHRPRYDWPGQVGKYGLILDSILLAGADAFPCATPLSFYKFGETRHAFSRRAVAWVSHFIRGAIDEEPAQSSLLAPEETRMARAYCARDPARWIACMETSAKVLNIPAYALRIAQP